MKTTVYYRRYLRFVTPIDFSFVHILQLGDDMWPHSREGSEKPITKDFQFSHLNLIGRLGTPGSTGTFCNKFLSIPSKLHLSLPKVLGKALNFIIPPCPVIIEVWLAKISF